MKRLWPMALAVKCSALLLALSAPGMAQASAYAYVDCSIQSNACYGEAGSSQGPVTLIWVFQTNGTDAIFPQDCTNRNYCRFWCPRYPGWISARVYAYDANFNRVAASDWVPALCTQQDEVLLGNEPPASPDSDR